MNVLLLTQNLVGTGFNRFAAAEITGVDGTVGAFFLYALLDLAQANVGDAAASYVAEDAAAASTYTGI